MTPRSWNLPGMHLIPNLARPSSLHSFVVWHMKFLSQFNLCRSKNERLRPTWHGRSTRTKMVSRTAPRDSAAAWAGSSCAGLLPGFEDEFDEPSGTSTGGALSTPESSSKRRRVLGKSTPGSLAPSPSSGSSSLDAPTRQKVEPLQSKMNKCHRFI